MGRPSLYTPELIEAIAERLAKGEPMAVICRDEGMPHPSTIRDWMAERADVSLAIARAREDGFDVIAAEALSIADTDRICEKVKYGSDGEVIDRTVVDMVDRSRLQVDTRLKLLAKWDPKRYGERQVIEHDVSGNLADKLKAARERAAKR